MMVKQNIKRIMHQTEYVVNCLDWNQNLINRISEK